MALDFARIQFPWELFQQAQQAQNQNQQQMFQNVQGIGEGLGTIGTTLEQEKAKATLAQLLAQSQNQPNFSSQTGQSMAVTPGGQQQPTPPPPDFGKLFGLGQKAYGDANNPFKSLLADQFDPLKQSQVAENQAKAKWYNIRSPGGAQSYLGNLSWETASPQQQNLAEALAKGNIRPSDIGYRDRGQIVLLANEYAKEKGIPFQSYTGDVHAGMAKSLAYGKLGQNSLALNTAIGHTATASDAFEAVKNTDIAFLNRPINLLRKETNDPNIVKLGLTLNALKGELANVFKASGSTDQEIGSWAEYLNENLTPSQAMGAIEQIDVLLRSRIDALKYQQHDVMDNAPSERTLVSPTKLSSGRTLGDEKVRSFLNVDQAEAAHLPKGTKVMIGKRSATIK